jgi:hypothetical protein
MASDQGQKISGQAASTLRSAQDAAQKAGEQIKDESARLLDEEKSMAADEVRKIGWALHSAADTLRESKSFLADWADSTAGTIERASQQIGERKFGEMVQTANDYARRHPAMVIGGLFLTGIAASRFFKATPQHEEPVTAPRRGPVAEPVVAPSSRVPETIKGETI